MIPELILSRMRRMAEERVSEARERLDAIRDELPDDLQRYFVGNFSTDDQAIGRSMADAPDIDGLVYLSQPEGLNVGDIVTARITHADDYDLFA